MTMLWTIFMVLLILWLLGFSLSVGGGLIHYLTECRLLLLLRRAAMFSTKNWIYLGLIVSALAVFIPRSTAQTISCSSDDGKRHYCSANGSGRPDW